MTLRKHPIAPALAAAALAGLGWMSGSASAATQVAPANSTPPTISGTARVGQMLTSTNGTWSNGPAAYAYQWLRCNPSGAACAPAANGTQKTYTLVGADAGRRMRVRVTASNADGSAVAESEPTGPVAASVVPRNTDRPIVSGTPELGETQTVDVGYWSGDPTSYAYQWQRCEADNFVSCADIPGATAKTYTTRATDVGYRLRGQVTARNAGGSAIATSAATAVIRPKLRIVNGRPTLSILSVRVLGHTVYARFRVCDDSSKNLTVIQKTSRTGAPSYSRRFSTLNAPAPCGVYTRHWNLVQRFRGHRITVTLTARDKSGRASASVRRAIARG
jgi:hypothetical protein